MTRPLTLAVLVGLLTSMPAVARAQNGDAAVVFRSVGAFIGWEGDYEDHFIVLGGEARIDLPRVLMGLQVNPRFTYHPLPFGTATQIDVNLLHNFELAMPARVLPYVGGGVALHHESDSDFDFSETNPGLNVVAGLRVIFDPTSNIEGFVHTQYTYVHEIVNPFDFTFGVSIHLH